MTKYIIFIFLSSVLTTFGQVNTIKVKKQKFASATFPGGKDSLTKYLDNNINETISSDLSLRQKIQKQTPVEAIVNFNTNGKIDKVELIKSSLHSDIDSLFIKTLKKMPNWIPATDEIGKVCKDKQTLSWTIETKNFSIISTSISEPNCKTSEYSIFPGGQVDLKKFINTNLKWPGPLWDTQGTVYLKFKVDTIGNVSNPTVLKGIDDLANAEALRLISIMPKWIPAKCDGKPIESWQNIPIKFKISDQK